jgi:hypothetical protein
MWSMSYLHILHCFWIAIGLMQSQGIIQMIHTMAIKRILTYTKIFKTEKHLLYSTFKEFNT